MQGKGHKGARSTCGHVHVSHQCPLKVKIVALVGKLKKSVKFKNNLDLTAQGTVMNQEKFDDIERVGQFRVADGDERIADSPDPTVAFFRLPREISRLSRMTNAEMPSRQAGKTQCAFKRWLPSSL